MRRLPFLAGARGRLLMFNLLVVAVTLMVSGVAIVGFNHAGKLQEQVQAQTLKEMNGSMALSRDTSNVATAAIRLSQVVGALEYQSESARLKQTQLALQASLSRLADAPLARSEPELVRRIISRSNALESSVTRMLELGHARHLQRNILLSGLYQSQSTLRHIASMNQHGHPGQPPQALLSQIDRLLSVAIQTPTPKAAAQQLDSVMAYWPPHSPDGLVNDKMRQFRNSQQRLLPETLELEQSDLALAYYTYHIKALVAMLNDDINLYVQKVAGESDLRTHQTHRELSSISIFIALFALLALVITGFAGLYIYRNLGSNLTAIANAMTRLARGERDVGVPALQRRDELGELARAFNVFARNTASLEQTSRLLKEKSTQLETTFLAMRDGFALFDNAGQLVVWNPQYPLLLGLREHQLHRGQHYRELLQHVTPPPGQRWEAVLANLTSELPQPQELRLSDGRTVELRFSPVPNRGVVNVVLERTERKALEEALLHSQKMKAVGQLTGGLAHDFNNLLAVIIGSLELTAGQSQDAQTGQRIARALKAAERGAQLTQRLLAFSRKQALHPQAVVLRALVENLQELLSHSLPPTLSLNIEAQQPGWLAWIDANQLENALINLVVNARDAMEGRSGVVKIRIYNQRVVRSDGKKQDMVALEVIDSGSGMSEEVKVQAFEPFFTTKAVGSGSGLGLSMVYGFVRQSGGRVQIESRPGEGTLVRLQLPRAPTPRAAEAVAVQPEDRDSADHLVLVLEDENDVRQTLCEHLHQLGYLTLDCADGREALALLAQTPDIRLMISDLMLPGELNGAQTIARARALNPQLTTLLISGQDLRQHDAGELADIELLRKPFSQRQLALALQRARRRNASDDAIRRE
ncbi:Blue-light-activated protein [Serratia entomophila]|uniref:ATP-binding protein n=1 Tax=Serratia entomophila TaxID=42906 RepID=UPI001F160C9E|nr:ATP-binding protein [Serratia entomophila]UIW19237.1 PAS-domain containing protein [Serratia entomophila]CAI0775353.1 Blue-light-activated protein [Serratia entomophila]CAI0818023.1 Blue-light-activated protein [Serratia entomophila]CAI0822131.1 Blue-light-activated protein [Serratia entomophila]CAI0822459.1 Blue-light-activated protein [Serratia entomophila]